MLVLVTLRLTARGNTVAKQLDRAVAPRKPLATTAAIVAICLWANWGLAQDLSSGTVTYAGQIASILNTHCVVCHRPSAIAPFSLTTFDAVKGRAEQIAQVVQSGNMPPWKPESVSERFRGERRLQDNDVELIRRWVDAGAPEGNPQITPVSPVWPEGWHSGIPDLVVTMPASYTLAPDSEIYRNFVIPIPVEERRFVAAIELKPSTTQGIHHARLMIDSTGSARRQDNADDLVGYDEPSTDGTEFPDGHFLGWAPGTLAGNAPEELAWLLEPGTDLVVKTHLVSRNTPVNLQLSVGLFFTDKPPTVTPAIVQLGSQTIDVPAGDPTHVVEDTYQLPVDVDLLAIYPHAHFLAKQIRASARLPNGTVLQLIRIDDWDFNWQDEYRYTENIRLPAGTTIRMRYVFDNSTNNRRNPHNPPKRVRFGPRSTDEMAELTLQVVPVRSTDRTMLVQDVWRKVSEIILAGAQKKLTDNPSSENHESFATSLAAVGRIDDAVRHLEEAARLDPARPTVYYRLGTALALQDKQNEAMYYYQRALNLDPNFVEANNNLGSLFHLAGNLDEASRYYRRTLDLDPDHSGAHFNLGNIFLARRQFSDAELEFRKTLELRPDFGEAFEGLGQALAEQGKQTEAQEALNRARELELRNR